MEKEKFLKMFSKKMAIFGAIGTTIPISMLVSFFFLQIEQNTYSILLISTITVCSFAFFLYFFWSLCKSMRELGDYWDNLILYDNKFVPNIKKKYHNKLKKIKVNLFEMTVYQFVLRMRYILPMILSIDLLINLFLLYKYIVPEYRYPEYYQFLEETAFLGNVMFLSMPLILFLMILAISFSYRLYNFVVIREKDLLIITQINDSIIKNFIPLKEIDRIEIVMKKGTNSGTFKSFRNSIHWNFNHPKNGLFIPSTRSKDLVSIKTKMKIEILQYGSLIRNKKPKRYEYVNTNDVLLELVEPEKFIDEVNQLINE